MGCTKKIDADFFLSPTPLGVPEFVGDPDDLNEACTYGKSLADLRTRAKGTTRTDDQAGKDDQKGRPKGDPKGGGRGGGKANKDE